MGINFGKPRLKNVQQVVILAIALSQCYVFGDGVMTLFQFITISLSYFNFFTLLLIDLLFCALCLKI